MINTKYFLALILSLASGCAAIQTPAQQEAKDFMAGYNEVKESRKSCAQNVKVLYPKEWNFVAENIFVSENARPEDFKRVMNEERFLDKSEKLVTGRIVLADNECLLASINRMRSVNSYIGEALVERNQTYTADINSLLMDEITLAEYTKRKKLKDEIFRAEIKSRFNNYKSKLREQDSAQREEEFQRRLDGFISYVNQRNAQIVESNERQMRALRDNNTFNKPFDCTVFGNRISCY